MFPLDNLNLTIDCIYKKLLENLTDKHQIKDVSSELLSMTDNHERVFYVYKLIKSHNPIPLIVKEDKCEYSSTHYRNLGNVCYQRAELFTAWQYYNLALMYSPLLAPSYSLAVANRSAVLVAMKKYKECLQDIRMVFTISYPHTIRDKLLKRKKQCEDALQAAEDPDFDDENELVEEIFTFKGTRHEKFVDASSKLKVKHSPEMGRHVVAKKHIEVGEIIVQEDPYVRVLLRPQVLMCCAYCFSRKFNLYPCPYCCVTMYCSRSCVRQAWKEYHCFECPLIAGLFQANFTKLELLALRTTVKARTDHTTWDDVLNTVSEAEACHNADDLGCKLEGDNLIYASKHYPSVHTLSTNIEKRDISDIFQKAVSAAILMHYLAVANFCKTSDPDLKERIKRFTANTLMRHLMTAPTNMHGITANVQNDEGNYVDEYNIGSGAYPFLSLINHSCTPNVVRYTRLGTSQMTLIALRPIKKGMQIFDNYGYYEVLRDEEQMALKEIIECEPSERCVRAALAACGNPNKNAHHAVHSKEDRQMILKSQYKFTCICEACTDDWPLYHGLNVITNLPAAIANKITELLNGNVIEALQKADKKRALKLFKPLCELATALEPYIPCKEAAECQETLKQCLAIISGVLPNGFNKFIEWQIPSPKVPGEPSSSRFYIGLGAKDLN